MEQRLITVPRQAAPLKKKSRYAYDTELTLTRGKRPPPRTPPIKMRHIISSLTVIILITLSISTLTISISKLPSFGFQVLGFTSR